MLRESSKNFEVNKAAPVRLGGKATRSSRNVKIRFHQERLVQVAQGALAFDPVFQRHQEEKRSANQNEVVQARLDEEDGLVTLIVAGTGLSEE